MQKMIPELKCSICAGRSLPDFVKHDYWIYTCETCKHRFANISQSPQHTAAVYGDGYFFEGGSGYLDYTSESDLLIAHGERYADLLRKYVQPGTVFDVGAAAGFILKGLTQKGWMGRGIEPNATMAAYARRTMHLDVETGMLEQYRTEQKFDLVTMIQVIAHFHDVRKALAITRDMLHKDGLLLVETWNRESLPARLLGANWHHYSPPSVVNWFSVAGLQTFVQQFGFAEVARGRPAKWITGAHAKSLLKYKLTGMCGGNLVFKAVNIMPDKLQIPYPSLDLFWALYKKLH
jgi:2-polyprenyl-3-methyl-5-hydroxy-6-metoxy-1,4-benzoquinol methylase